MIYREQHFWSPTLGLDAVRLSIGDGRGGEFFVIVPREDAGKRWRERREQLLDALGEAIERGDEPGEVRYEDAA